MGRNGYTDYWVTGNNFNYPSQDEVTPGCPGTCVPLCEDFDIKPHPDNGVMNCNLPCNTTMYMPENSGPVPVEGCPGCTIDILYSHRKTTDCTPEFYDYQIHSITPSAGCSTCFLDEQQMFEYAINWVLKNGEHPLPALNECDDVYRVAYAACWEWRNPLIEDIFVPCSMEGCCWSLYELCNDDGDITVNRIWGTTSNYQDCGLPQAACVFICDEELIPPVINGIDEQDLIKRGYSVLSYSKSQLGKNGKFILVQISTGPFPLRYLI